MKTSTIESTTPNIKNSKFLLFGTLLIACCTTSSCFFDIRKPISESSMITFTQPEFSLQRGSTFYWLSDLVFLFNDARQKPKDVRPFLQYEIQSHLEHNGYRFVSVSDDAQYGLVAVVVLGEGMTAADVLNRFDLTPSFKASRIYEQGTMVIAIFDRATQKIMWRGALQANVNLKLPPEERRKRVQWGVNKLLSSLPQSTP